MSHSSPTASHLPTTSSPMTGPLAVEVVATLGDSVVGVRHVSRPDSGRLRPLTKALLLGGAALLATGAIGFATATRIAHDNEVRRQAWTAAHKPAYGFRPTLVSPAHDALTFFGLGLGLTAIATGLVRRRRELQPSTIRVGSAASTDFALAETVDHALVRPEGDHFVVDLGPLRVDGGAAPAGTVVVVPGLRLTAHAGLTQFHIAAVEAPREHAVPVFAGGDRRALAFLAASAVAHLAMFAIARAVPPDADSAAIGIDSSEQIEGYLASTTQETPPPPPPEPGEGDAAGEGGPEAASMSLPEGMMGAATPDPRPSGQRQIGRDADQQQLARVAIEQASTSGVLGSRMLRGDLFAAFTGTGDVASGFDRADFLGGPDGSGPGAPQGFGHGLSGRGPGGSGLDLNGISTGRFGTCDENCGGGGLKFGPGGSGGLRKRTAEVPTTPRSSIKIIGDIDRELVRRYVRRKLAQITYCYEKELLGKPGLDGTVTADFTFNHVGAVIDSSASGVDPTVSSCIAGVISTITFPKTAGGVYRIKYPFDLHTTGK